MASTEERGFHGAFRQSMTWLHTWTGLVFSLVLYFVFITGAVGYFNYEIDLWMQPEAPAEYPSTPASALAQTGFDYLQVAAPDSTRQFVTLPMERGNGLVRVFATLKQPREDGATSLREQIDGATGQPVDLRDTGGGNALYRMHYRLHYLPYTTAIYIVGVATLFMLLALVTGIVVHKKIFADFFTLRLYKGQRSWLDGHNMSSVLALPFMLMITYSGLVFYEFEYLPGVMALTVGTGEEAREEMYAHLYPGRDRSEASGVAAEMAPIAGPVAHAESRWGEGSIRYVELRHPGQSNAVVTIGRRGSGIERRTETLKYSAMSGELLGVSPDAPPNTIFSDAVLALHEGRFAAPALRWLYFISGLVGAAMIATGLLLWAKKRRSRLKPSVIAPSSLVFVERSNLGIIVGLPLGVLAYFWANRLLPVAMDSRAEWELHILFLAWACSFMHAGARETACAWREQVGLLALLLLFLPMLNLATTSTHLIATLSAGDWERAGFDLFALASGLILCLVWPKLRQPERRSQAAAHETTFAGSEVLP